MRACYTKQMTWWRQQMETFSALLVICAGNSPVPVVFPTQRPVARSCDVFFDLRLNKRLSNQSCDWWFETLSRLLWRHRNDIPASSIYSTATCERTNRRMLWPKPARYDPKRSRSIAQIAYLSGTRRQIMITAFESISKFQERVDGRLFVRWSHMGVTASHLTGHAITCAKFIQANNNDTMKFPHDRPRPYAVLCSTIFELYTTDAISKNKMMVTPI